MKPMSLTGLSGEYEKPNDDSEIVKKLEEKEAEQNMSKEQKEIIQLMTNNKSGSAYKTALGNTIKEVRQGVVGKAEEHGE